MLFRDVMISLITNYLIGHLNIIKHPECFPGSPYHHPHPHRIPKLTLNDLIMIISGSLKSPTYLGYLVGFAIVFGNFRGIISFHTLTFDLNYITEDTI